MARKQRFIPFEMDDNGLFVPARSIWAWKSNLPSNLLQLPKHNEFYVESGATWLDYSYYSKQITPTNVFWLPVHNMNDILEVVLDYPTINGMATVKLKSYSIVAYMNASVLSSLLIRHTVKNGVFQELDTYTFSSRRTRIGYLLEFV